MLDEFVGKKYPSIMVQGVLLTSSVLYLEHGRFNWSIIITIVIILSLSILQSINHRFFYHFRGNKFMQRETRSWDTYFLYVIILFSLLFFIYGI